jgi:hypothetical protein
MTAPLHQEDEFKAKLDAGLWWKLCQRALHLKRFIVPLAIAAIAIKPYALSVWDKDAKALAAQMGPAWLNQLLFTMVQPPNLPQLDHDPFFWVQKCQIAIALVVANLDPGWEGSARKRALESLARGPVDWTIDAAVIAMGWLAKHDPAIRPGVVAITNTRSPR